VTRTSEFGTSVNNVFLYGYLVDSTLGGDNMEFSVPGEISMLANIEVIASDTNGPANYTFIYVDGTVGGVFCDRTSPPSIGGMIRKSVRFEVFIHVPKLSPGTSGVTFSGTVKINGKSYNIMSSYPQYYPGTMMYGYTLVLDGEVDWGVMLSQELVLGNPSVTLRLAGDRVTGPDDVTYITTNPNPNANYGGVPVWTFEYLLNNAKVETNSDYSVSVVTARSARPGYNNHTTGRMRLYRAEGTFYSSYRPPTQRVYNRFDDETVSSWSNSCLLGPPFPRWCLGVDRWGMLIGDTDCETSGTDKFPRCVAWTACSGRNISRFKKVNEPNHPPGDDWTRSDYSFAPTFTGYDVFSIVDRQPRVTPNMCSTSRWLSVSFDPQWSRHITRRNGSWDTIKQYLRYTDGKSFGGNIEIENTGRGAITFNVDKAPVTIDFSGVNYSGDELELPEGFSNIHGLYDELSQFRWLLSMLVSKNNYLLDYIYNLDQRVTVVEESLTQAWTVIIDIVSEINQIWEEIRNIYDILNTIINPKQDNFMTIFSFIMEIAGAFAPVMRVFGQFVIGGLALAGSAVHFADGNYMAGATFLSMGIGFIGSGAYQFFRGRRSAADLNRDTIRNQTTINNYYVNKNYVTNSSVANNYYSSTTNVFHVPRKDVSNASTQTGGSTKYGPVYSRVKGYAQQPEIFANSGIQRCKTNVVEDRKPFVKDEVPDPVKRVRFESHLISGSTMGTDKVFVKHASGGSPAYLPGELSGVRDLGLVSSALKFGLPPTYIQAGQVQSFNASKRAIARGTTYEVVIGATGLSDYKVGYHRSTANGEIFTWGCDKSEGDVFGKAVSPMTDYIDDFFPGMSAEAVFDKMIVFHTVLLCANTTPIIAPVEQGFICSLSMATSTFPDAKPSMMPIHDWTIPLLDTNGEILSDVGYFSEAEFKKRTQNISVFGMTLSDVVTPNSSF